MVKQKGPNIVFLMETRLPVRSLEWLRVRLGMLGCLGVERNGIGGGLALLWDATVTVNIQSYSTHHIDVDVIQQEGVHWRLIGFYGHLERALRYHSWNLLCHLCQSQVSHWLVLGDFNEIMQLEEKWGGQDRSVAQMTAFREALSDCLLQDLGYQGADFTWTNGRKDAGLVRVRLDRIVSNEAWFQLFPTAINSHIPVASSDHMALLLDTMENTLVQPTIRRRRKLFRFEKAWVREPGCEEQIVFAWDIQPIGTGVGPES